MVIVIFSPVGPSPKNCGLSLVIISPSSMLLSVTIVDFAEGSSLVMLIFDSALVLCGKFRLAPGFIPEFEGERFLKS